MAGVGLYHGEKALALGYGYAPNDRLFLNASVGIAKEEQMYGMGATWRIGAGESLVKKKITKLWTTLKLKMKSFKIA